MAGRGGEGNGGTRNESDYGPQSLHAVRKAHVLRALRAADGDPARAAALLGVTVAELRHLVQRLGLEDGGDP